ncbi:hypothetical protein ACTVMN_10175 [Serratia nematodiphila]
MAIQKLNVERGIVTFFDLEKFGLYKIRHGKDAELIEDNIKEVLAGIHSWVDQRSIEHTVPWGTDNNKKVKAYCKNISHDPITGDYVFVVWKTIGDNSGNIQGIEATGKVDGDSDNTISASDTHEGKKVIWGLPCYYWVIPEYNKIASVKFPTSYADTELFCRYVKAYVDYRMEHPCKTVHDITKPRAGSAEDLQYKKVTFSQGNNDSLVFKVYAQQTKLITKGANIDELCKKITHIVYRDTIETNVPDNRKQWLKLFDAVGGVFTRSSPLTSKKHYVELVVDGSPTPDEFRDLIEKYIDENELCDDPDAAAEYKLDKKWDNIGFKTQGRSGTTTWLNEYVYRHEILVDSSNKNKHYSSSFLLSKLMAHRKEFTTCFSAPENNGNEVIALDNPMNDDTHNVQQTGS